MLRSVNEAKSFFCGLLPVARCLTSQLTLNLSDYLVLYLDLIDKKYNIVAKHPKIRYIYLQ
jgi:hypothetical protein